MGRKGGNFWNDFYKGWQVGDAMQSKYEKAGLQSDLAKASNVTPETNTAYNEDQAANIDALANDVDANGQPLNNMQANPDGTYTVTPNAGGESVSIAPKTNYSMGGKTQETPFLPEQVDAQKLRNRADVYGNRGMEDKAASLHGLAKQREEEGITSKIRGDVELGLSRDYADLKGMDKEWKRLSLAADASMNAGRYDQWASLAKAGEGIQAKLLNSAMDKADMITDPHAKLTAQLDAYNRYVLDARTGGGVTKKSDGSFSIKLSDDSVFNVKNDDDIAKIGMYMRDPSFVRKLQQDAAIKIRDRVAGREDKQWEWQNKPMEVGKGSSVIIPGSGKEITSGANSGFNVKDQQSVLDDLRNHAVQVKGKFDDTTGKWTWTPEATDLAGKMERLYMANTGLPPTALRDIADKGTQGVAVVESGGKQQRVPAISYNGRTYLIGGQDSGMADPTLSPRPATSSPGLSTVTPARQSTASPSNFPRVSRSEQDGRDQLAGKMIVEESGIDAARRNLSEIDAALKSNRLGSTQRTILQTERGKIAAGLAALP